MTGAAENAGKATRWDIRAWWNIQFSSQNHRRPQVILKTSNQNIQRSTFHVDKYFKKILFHDGQTHI